MVEEVELAWGIRGRKVGNLVALTAIGTNRCVANENFSLSSSGQAKRTAIDTHYSN
jgi:hypothetical protein